MKNKFLFLTKESIKKKIGTKSFKIVNIFLCILVIGLIYMMKMNQKKIMKI